MSDLKSQLADVKKKLATFDDDLTPESFADTPVKPDEPTYTSAATKIERLFQIVCDNPGIGREELWAKAARQGIINGTTATFMRDMVNRRNLIRVHSGPSGPTYYVTAPYYSREMQPRKTKAFLAKTSKSESKPKVVPTPGIVAPQDLGVQELLNTLPIAKARALYDELKKIFGG